MRWLSDRSLIFSPIGKHFIDFPPNFPLRLFCCHFTSPRITPNYHDYLEISYIYEGRCLFHIRNESFAVTKGDVVLISNNEMHSLEFYSNIPMKIMSIFFLQDFIFKPGDGTLNFEYISPFFHLGNLVEKKERIYNDTNHMIFKKIQKIVNELDAQQAHYQQAVKNHMLDILLILLRNYGKKAKRRKKNLNKASDIDRLKGVIRYIQDNYNQKITLLHLSKIACMSPTSFCRYFKKVTGTTTSSYIMRTRIDHAKELLMKSDLSITQIAFEIGIQDHSYFDRIFRRFNNMSPKDFRKNQNSTRI